MADNNRVQSEGAIYINNFKDKDTKPDWTGKVELSKQLLKDLVTRVKEGGNAELRVALWDRTSKNNNEYKFARLDIPMEKKEEPVKEEPVKQESTESNFNEDDIPF